MRILETITPKFKRILGVLFLLCLLIWGFLGFPGCSSWKQNIKSNQGQEKFCNSDTLEIISEKDPDLLSSFTCICGAGDIEGSSQITCDSAFANMNALKMKRECSKKRVICKDEKTIEGLQTVCVEEIQVDDKCTDLWKRWK